MYEKIAIIGTGDFVRQMAVLANQTGQIEVVGFIDQSVRTTLGNSSIIGTDDDVLNLYESHQIDCISGYALFQLCKRLYNRFVSQVPFTTIIHLECRIDESVFSYYSSRYLLSVFLSER